MKQSIRQSIITARSGMEAAVRTQFDREIVSRIIELPEYRAATTVLGYMNFGAEFAAERVVGQALVEGKRVLLPKANSETKQLDIYCIIDEVVDVAPGLWGIREPLVERCAKVDDLKSIDFILLPGVAFARDGARLGYGGGFYDKLLARMFHHPALVAACYAQQVVESLPQEATDRKVQWLITEQETIQCGA